MCSLDKSKLVIKSISMISLKHFLSLELASKFGYSVGDVCSEVHKVMKPFFYKYGFLVSPSSGIQEVNGNGVVFSWISRDCYYVVLRDMDIDYNGYRIKFRVLDSNNSSSTQNRSVVFSLDKVENTEIVFTVKLELFNVKTNMSMLKKLAQSFLKL